ncbi:TVP38/TMEM64 family protein [Salinibacterium sp. NG22]|uniref:TVP38/TMEM64 family protein n=1 Tax=Salinibacterium sp. NG22 TaxID=2792040 RepID=UPI0018CCE80E|nr:TVP38/TMEM64 family protein [Salinibacterium sp. NG22]MBH0110088.1 TVP38/TMEM64 family protein [Salinibacterium sp. NG22]
MKKNRSSSLWKAGAFVVFLIAIVIVAFTIEIPSVDEIQGWAEGTGLLGAVIFIVAYAVLTLTPAPKAVISIAAGLAWGLWIGTLLVLVGAVIGAALSFWIGRLLGRDAVEQYTGGKVRAVDEMLQKRGLLSMIALRLIPLIPFTVINYAAGLTAVRVRDYMIGTAVGIIPGTMAFVAVGAYGAELNSGFFIALGALGVLTIGGGIVAGRLRKKDAAAAAAAGESPVLATTDDVTTGDAAAENN